MNMFKSNGGFTLVELIVVIAILAILASVAVPAYSGYIDKAKEAEGDVAEHYFKVLDKANDALKEAGIDQIAAESGMTRPATEPTTGNENAGGGEG